MDKLNLIRTINLQWNLLHPLAAETDSSISELEKSPLKPAADVQALLSCLRAQFNELFLHVCREIGRTVHVFTHQDVKISFTTFTNTKNCTNAHLCLG